MKTIFGVSHLMHESFPSSKWGEDRYASNGCHWWFSVLWTDGMHSMWGTKRSLWNAEQSSKAFWHEGWDGPKF